MISRQHLSTGGFYVNNTVDRIPKSTFGLWRQGLLSPSKIRRIALTLIGKLRSLIYKDSKMEIPTIDSSGGIALIAKYKDVTLNKKARDISL